MGKNLLTIDPPEFNYERLKRENYIPHPTVFVDHKLLVQSHGFGKFTYAMDYDLWLRMSKKITAVKFPLIVSSFRKNKKSLTSSNVWATTIEDYKIRCRLPRRYDIIVRDFINFVYGLFLSWKI